MSSARFIMVLILIPAAGKISNNVTTGPSFTLITFISILKSSKTLSSNSEFALIFSLSDLFLSVGLSVSKMSKDGE